MIGRLIAGCTALSLLTVQLPGCGLTANVESMLSPPRLTVEQEQIYQALQIAYGSQISLKYPKSGDRLSAFIFEDLDGDSFDEAVVFYEMSGSTAEENPLRICLLDQKDGVWDAVSNAAAAGAEIDRVDIERLGSNSRMNLIISYSMVDGAEHAVQVFHYEDQLIENRRETYSAMVLRDLDMDGTTELFVASAAKASSPATADVYALDENGTYHHFSRELPSTMTDVSRIVYGELPTGTGRDTIPAIYLDGGTGATTVQTVVLTYREHQLSLLYADNAERFPKTERAGGYQTMDIDDDREAEIPVNMAFYGYSNALDSSPLVMTNWYVCRNGLLMREYSSYYSSQNSFVFLMPKRWERCVTAVQENEEIVFYTFTVDTMQENPEPILLKPLLRLAVVPDPIEADAMQSEGYLLLRQQNSRYYLGKIEQDTPRSLRLTPSELLVSMRFLQ